MTVEAIDFAAQEARGLEQLAGAPALAVNCITDASKTTRQRPGVAAWSIAPAAYGLPIVGMVSNGAYLYYITSDRRSWALKNDGTSIALSALMNISTLLPGTARPWMLASRDIVADSGAAAGNGVCLAAGGDQLLAFGNPAAASPASAVVAASPTASSICQIASRIVASDNDTSGRFQWSDPGVNGYLNWDALNFEEAEAKPDPLQAVADNANELFAFGTQTIQIYSPDAVQGFAPGRALSIGTFSPYSIIRFDDMFVFLDSERRFVLTDGRSFSDQQSVISRPIEAHLRQFSNITDCWGFRMRTDRWDCAVWMFPTDGKGLIWNRRTGQWSEWLAYGTSGYAAPMITSAVEWPEQNVFLVGLSNGQIAKLDANSYTDLGSTVKVELVGGFNDHGTFNAKSCDAVRFIFKRGQNATEPVVNVSWRDDLGPFGRPRRIGLGTLGDSSAYAQLRSTGVYRKRQWRIEYTSNAELSFVGAQEEFTVLSA